LGDFHESFVEVGAVNDPPSNQSIRKSFLQDLEIGTYGYPKSRLTFGTILVYPTFVPSLLRIFSSSNSLSLPSASKYSSP
jgi:hypothetical protein